MKKILIALLAVLMLTPAWADEGMWLPVLIGQRIKDMRAKGFKLKAEDVYSGSKPSLCYALPLP